jgi:uncharacterized membrane protein
MKYLSVLISTFFTLMLYGVGTWIFGESVTKELWFNYMAGWFSCMVFSESWDQLTKSSDDSTKNS